MPLLSATPTPTRDPETPGLPYLKELRDKILIPKGIVTNLRSSSYSARSCYKFSISWLILFNWAGPPEEDLDRFFSSSLISSTLFIFYYWSTIILLGVCWFHHRLSRTLYWYQCSCFLLMLVPKVIRQLIDHRIDWLLCSE